MAQSTWTQSEITATVVAYQGMLDSQRRGDKYNKAQINRTLRAGAVKARSRGSIEMRMCNISAVMVKHGRPFVFGYKPRGNVGAQVITMIEIAFSSTVNGIITLDPLRLLGEAA